MKDIDDLLRSAGREAAGPLFARLREDAVSVLDHLAGSLEGDTPEDKKNELAQRFARLIARLPPLAEEKWQKRMRTALGASARTVQKIVTQATKPPKARPRPRPSGPKPPAVPTGVRGLLYRWGSEGLERVELKEVDGQTVEHSEVVSSFVIRIERVAEVIDDLRNHKEFECRLLRKGEDLDAPGWRRASRVVRSLLSSMGVPSRLTITSSVRIPASAAGPPGTSSETTAPAIRSSP